MISLQNTEGLGYIRITYEADHFVDIDELAGDTYNPEANPDIPKARIDREFEVFKRRIEAEGVWSVLAQYRLDLTADNWQTVDSIWGFVGQDCHDYEGDLLESAYDGFKTAVSKLLEDLNDGK